MIKLLKKSTRWAVRCLTALVICACGTDESENVDLKIIRDCKELGVAEFNFHKIIVERNTVSALGVAGNGIFSLPERTLIVPVDVKVIGSIDFSNITKDNLIKDGDELIFILPDPILRIESCLPDYKMIEKASKEQWWRGGSFNDNQIREVANQAKDSIIIEKTLKLMTERTCANAFDILRPIISLATGIAEENIKVQFDSRLNLSKVELMDKTIIFKREE